MAPQIYPPNAPTSDSDPVNTPAHHRKTSEFTPTTTAVSNITASSPLWENRFTLLAGAYLALTSTLVYRISRSPLSTGRKWEQYETVFKGTTLAGVVVGVGLSGGLNRRRSEFVRERERGRDDERERTEEVSEKSEKEKREAREIVRRGGVQRD